MELRIHGIGAHKPYEVLGAPMLRHGDNNIGVYSLPPIRRLDVHAFVWSRTTRRWLGSYRYLLLPFTLVNVAGFMQDTSRPGGSLAFGALLHLLGATITVAYIFWFWALFADLPRFHGADPEWQELALWSVLLLFFGGVLARAAFAKSGPRAPAGYVVLSDDKFWEQTGRRGAFFMHAALTFAVMEGINLATGWDGNPMLRLFLLQFTLLVGLGAVVYVRGRHVKRPSEMGGLFALSAAVVLTHLAFAGVFLVITTAVERVHQFPLNAIVGLAVIRPGVDWQFIVVSPALAVVIWALMFFRASTSIGKTPEDIAACAAEYGVRPAAPPPWVAAVARMRARPFIRGMPANLLPRPVALAASIAVTWAAGWFGVFESGRNVVTAFLGGAIRQYWLIATGVVAIAMVAGLIRLAMASSAREKVATIYDVLGYWPRAYHPLAPLSYAGVTSAALAAFLELHFKSHDHCTVIAHSQGSVVAYTTLLRLPAEIRRRVDLVTCGSPLASLYAASFPKYFQVGDYASLRDELRSWTNLYRDTDPIGTAIFVGTDASNSDTRILEPDPKTAIMGHSGYWDDPEMHRILDELRLSKEVERPLQVGGA